MFLARVKKIVTATAKHPAYCRRRVFVVQPVDPEGKADGDERVAMDSVGAGIGDMVICGGAPGVAREVFQLERAPIRTVIIGIVDRIDYRKR